MAYYGSATSAASNPTGVKEQHILTPGVKYSTWKSRLMFAVAAKGAKPVTLPNALERPYSEADPYTRMLTYVTYDQLQDKAKNVLIHRLTELDIAALEGIPTFLQMIAKLDERHQNCSDAGAVGARMALNNLRYDEKADFGKFIRLFESKLREATECGNIISERDAMYQLVTALGPKYISAINGMKQEPPHDQRFEIFVTKVQEIYNLEKIFAKSSSSNENKGNHQKQHHCEDKNPESRDQSDDRDRKKNTGPRCYACGKQGHKKPSCPDLNQREEKNTNSDNNTEKKDAPKKTLDWSRFVDAKKQTNNV